MRGGRRVRGHPVLQLGPPAPSRHPACDGEGRERRDAAPCPGEAARRGVTAIVAGGLWRNSDDRWSTPEMAMARLCEVSPEHDQSPAAYLRRPAVILANVLTIVAVVKLSLLLFIPAIL